MKILLFILIPVMVHSGVIIDELWDTQVRSERKLEKIAPEFGKKFGLEYVTGGVSLFRKIPEISWAFAYMSRQPMNEAQAAQLACDLFNYTIQELSKDPDHVKGLNEDLASTKLDTKRVAVRITYWDENFNRFYPPNVAQVAIWNDKVHIYKADPATEKLLPPTDYLPGCAK